MIGIVGPGALGHLFGFFLHRELPEWPLQILGRQGPEAIDAKIVWQGAAHTLRIEKRMGACSLLFFLVKSYQLEEALATHLPQLDPQGTVVILGNGYLEPLIAPTRARYPNLHWRKGIVTWGVRRDADQSYVIGKSGQVLWSGAEARSAIEEKLFRGLHAYGVDWAEEGCDLRRRKWFYNTVLNTLCGAYRLPSNGLALSMFPQDLEALAREVYALGRELWPQWTLRWEELWNGLIDLIHGTRDNENSMAYDVRLGRRTEADVLSGCIRLAKKAERYPLLAAFNARLPR